MKKIIAFTLVLSMLLAFAGCNETSQEVVMKTDIIGEWIAVNGNASITLKEDGTGVMEYNGTQEVTWVYNPDTDRYTVTGEESYEVCVGKDYQMPCLKMLDMDFYYFDDYDNAYTLLISRRCEDITNLTLDMTKIELNTTYDLKNAITIQFTEISINKNATNGTIQLVYTVTNNHKDPAENVSVAMNSKFYVTSHPKAVQKQEEAVFVHYMGGNEVAYGTISFSIDEKAAPTIEQFDRVIGAVYFEMYGGQFYLELGDFFYKQTQA